MTNPYRAGEPLPDLFALVDRHGLCAHPCPCQDEAGIHEVARRWNARFDAGEHPYCLHGPYRVVRYALAALGGSDGLRT
jgi:hypothetical protein